MCEHTHLCIHTYTHTTTYTHTHKCMCTSMYLEASIILYFKTPLHQKRSWQNNEHVKPKPFGFKPTPSPLIDPFTGVFKVCTDILPILNSIREV